MKKILFTISILLFFSSNTYTQNNVKDILAKVNLKGPVELPDSVQMRILIEQILQFYGDSFNYYNELKSGNYKLKIKDSKNSEYGIQIMTKDKKNIEIKVRKVESPLGGSIFSLDNEEINKLVTTRAKAFGFRSELMGGVSFIEKNDILIDKI